MSNPIDAAELIARIENGDDAAAREFCDRFQRSIRLWARRWLRAYKVPRVIGESDVFQEVAYRFLRKVEDGSFRFESAAQFNRFLHVLTWNVTREAGQKEHRERRDSARTKSLKDDPDPASAVPTAEEVAVRNELVANAMDSLSASDRMLIETWMYQRNLQQLAKGLGKTAGALRSRIQRVLRSLAKRFAAAGDPK
jgi:RNA polymerase sigma factor (sigma-70 family)